MLLSPHRHIIYQHLQILESVGDEMPWNVPDNNHGCRNNKQIIIDERRHNNSSTQMHFGHIFWIFKSSVGSVWKYSSSTVSQRPNTESLTSAAGEFLQVLHGRDTLWHPSLIHGYLANEWLLTSWFIFSVHDFVLVHRRLTPAINRKSQYFMQHLKNVVMWWSDVWH